MSEQDEQRPLTRRERRMREMGETGQLDLSEAQVTPPAKAETEDVTAESAPASDASPASADAAAPAAPAEIEISPFNEDGTPRSRREIRALREAAAVELAAARAAAAPAEVEESAADAAAEDSAAEDSAADEAAEVAAAEEAAPTESAELEIEAEELESSEIREVETEASEAAEAEAEGEDLTEGDEAQDQDAEAAAIVGEGADAVPAEEAAMSVEPEAGPAPLDGEPDFDSLIAPPTEPFTVQDLRDAENGGSAAQAQSDDVAELLAQGEAAAEVDADAGAPVEAEVAEEPVVAEAAEEEAAAKPKRRFWKRNKGEQAAEAEAAPVEVEAETVTETESAPVVAESVDPEPAVEAAPETAAEDPAQEQAEEAAEVIEIPAEPADVLPEAAPTEEAVAEAEPKPAVQPSPDQKESYSFPDIAPPEEWRSVFDDPSSRTMPGPAKADGDFDDLISRAVAQEGSGGQNTSALILPNMPEDTGGLSGPLGTTGDLYVTGSMKLPKSLGETGGHAALHDSIEMDPITGEAPEEAPAASEGPAPVSARHAVSARVQTDMPVVAKPAKEKSKLPLVLSLTGGGLVVAVAGIAIWGASNGMFG
ncbi:hypothetical protein [Leucobacter luti]|uniref:hypothetical protein n=1 Tax=Leucobacter luti TaxID=340320 RepID=UPI003D0860A6